MLQPSKRGCASGKREDDEAFGKRRKSQFGSVQDKSALEAEKGVILIPVN